MKQTCKQQKPTHSSQVHKPSTRTGQPHTGNKSLAEMTLAELDAAIGWLERNRLSDQLHLLDEDPRYAWTARKRGEWKPPVGRDKRSPNSL
jgi:hypothetical protein